ncbi:MAG: ubiquinol-cytochrome c reductase iron-sulfur subunit [Acidobacteriota bacterium]|nr:ubiquinol-cytochrome c reductase iron-sulfur subunit [Acidobacteriota bacterium]
MDNVQPLHREAGESPTRRRFHIGAINGMMAAISAALGLPALAYLFVPGKVRKQEEWVEAGDVSRLVAGVPVELTFRRNRIDGWKVINEKNTAWVVKSADNQVTAFGPQCTHLGCAYHWEAERNQFLCPCHTSLFAIDGRVTAGPAPRPLDRYQTRIDGTRLMLGRLEQAAAGERQA